MPVPKGTRLLKWREELFRHSDHFTHGGTVAQERSTGKPTDLTKTRRKAYIQ
ncbi:hypothetical protein [Desulfovibrio inopinatus]|uniref:hypothetical protein n=1 Tax=Desulfovibrio inopinatus TaxID=102109 RepID=UPI00146FB57C|nr:hypothetical protein [Desulfovibrio inopinatus]